MAISNEIQRLTQAKADIKAAIEAKGVTVPSSAKLDVYDDYIAQIEQGSTPTPTPPEYTVTFIDYDGTVLQTMSLAEAKALSALPSGPTHTGLTFQGWNFTLADITAASNASLTIGANYITDDGKTRLYITIPDEDDLYKTITLRWQESTANGIEINWGDGSVAYTVDKFQNTNNVWAEHTYQAAGDYVITIEAKSGTWATQNQSTTLIQFTDQMHKLKKVELGNGISAAEGLCYCMYDIESVTIPQYFSSYTFTYTFWNCNKLVSATIPRGVTTFTNDTFQSCLELASVSLPVTVSSLNGSIFRYCEALESEIYLPALTTLKTNCFYQAGITKIHNLGSITTIEANTFTQCTKLEKVVLPSTLTSIGNDAFSSCTALKTMTLPTSITTIGGTVFSSCTNWETDISLPSLTSLGQNAFRYCYKLKTVSIPSLTAIPQYAFQDCQAMTSCTLASNLTAVNTHAFENCYALTSITFPSTCKTFADSAFKLCRSLTSITIPSGTTTIAASAFAGCYAVKTLSLPNTLTTIGNNAFDSLKSLETLVVPSSVTSIGNGCFQNCESIKELRMEPTTPPTVSSGSLNNVPMCVITVPASAYSAYVSATTWSGWAVYMRKYGKTYSFGTITANRSFLNNGTTYDNPGAYISDYIPVTAGNTVQICRRYGMTPVKTFDSNYTQLSISSVNNASNATINSGAYIQVQYQEMFNHCNNVYDVTAKQLIYPFEQSS